MEQPAYPDWHVFASSASFAVPNSFSASAKITVGQLALVAYQVSGPMSVRIVSKAALGRLGNHVHGSCGCGDDPWRLEEEPVPGENHCGIRHSLRQSVHRVAYIRLYGTPS